MPERSGLLPLAPRTPEQRVEARLQRVVHTPRMPTARGGGVLLRSQLVERNEALARENDALRAQGNVHENWDTYRVEHNTK